MSNHQKHRYQLTGHFLGWGDDRPLHGYIKLATVDGDLLVKVAKSLRPHIQDWQPGICLTLLIQDTICRDTGAHKLKVKQVLVPQPSDSASDLPVSLPPARSIDPPSKTSDTALPTKIQVCQGASCRKRGSDRICQAMQAYVDRADLTERVEVETVKCLHQCKAAPHAIVGADKTHYRQIQPTQVQMILAKHFPVEIQPESSRSNLIEKIGNYLQQHQTYKTTSFPQF